jgi:hypothetical protein
MHFCVWAVGDTQGMPQIYSKQFNYFCAKYFRNQSIQDGHLLHLSEYYRIVSDN